MSHASRVTSCEDRGTLSRSEEEPSQMLDNRRLAAAAQPKVADADDRLRETTPA
jgi:hypothetical protein